jgi:hypothetical protein
VGFTTEKIAHPFSIPMQIQRLREILENKYDVIEKDF